MAEEDEIPDVREVPQPRAKPNNAAEIRINAILRELGTTIKQTYPTIILVCKVKFTLRVKIC